MYMYFYVPLQNTCLVKIQLFLCRISSVKTSLLTSNTKRLSDQSLAKLIITDSRKYLLNACTNIAPADVCRTEIYGGKNE